MKQSIIKILAGALALAAFVVLGRDHVELSKLRAKYDGASVVQVQDNGGHKMGAALVPQRAGDFFVSPVASSPFKLGQHVAYTDGTTPAISGDSSATSLAFGTNKAGAVAKIYSDANVLNASFSEASASNNQIDFYSPNGVSQAHWQTTNSGVLTLTTPSTNFVEFLVPPYAEIEMISTGVTTLANSQIFQNYLQTTTYGTFSSTGIALGFGAAANTLTGSLAYTTRTVTASFTVDTTTTDNIILVDTTSAAVTVTLPAPTNGRVLELIDKTNNFATHNCTLAQHSTEKINGTAASHAFATSGQRVDIWSDGTDWYTRASVQP